MPRKRNHLKPIAVFVINNTKIYNNNLLKTHIICLYLILPTLLDQFIFKCSILWIAGTEECSEILFFFDS